MKLLSALLLKIRFEIGEMRRRAYLLLRRFRRLESLWLVFLRSRGFRDFPEDKKERGIKILTVLVEQHRDKDFAVDFLRETRLHFMSAK
jgi:hypothetical protein